MRLADSSTTIRRCRSLERLHQEAPQHRIRAASALGPLTGVYLAALYSRKVNLIIRYKLYTPSAYEQPVLNISKRGHSDNATLILDSTKLDWGFKDATPNLRVIGENAALRGVPCARLPSCCIEHRATTQIRKDEKAFQCHSRAMTDIFWEERRNDERRGHL